MNSTGEEEKGLHCLGGQEAPEALTLGWQSLESLPSTSMEDFWQVLGAFMAEPGHPAFQNTLSGFCEAHGVQDQAAAQAIEACGGLASQASALNVRDTLLHEDVQKLAGDNTARCIEFIRHYAAVKPSLRKRILEATFTDHGKLLVGLDWRIDKIEASSRGNQIDASLLYLTLTFQEKSEVEKISLQLNQEGLMMLKSFTDRFTQEQ